MVTPVIGNEFLKGACNIVEDILRVNVGGESAVHPVVRTNPISGWKSISPIGSFPAQFNGLTRRESANMLQWFHDMITYGHDIQVRFKWNQPNDIAIWDNRRVFHTATGDHEGFGPGSGNRAAGVGEIPYSGPANKSRREDLAIEDTLAPCHW